MQPITIPAFSKAQGKLTIAVPIIVFQQEKIITIDFYFLPGSIDKVIKDEVNFKSTSKDKKKTYLI